MLDVLGKLLTANFIGNPIFLVGGSRSGTIALFKALGEHPVILSSPSEDPLACDVGRMAYDLGYASEEDAHYYERSVRISRDYIFDALRRLTLESAFGPHFGLTYLAKHCLKTRTTLIRKRHWCTKTFPGENTAKGLLALYPNAKFIWILRNGLHVVHSRTKFPEFRDLQFSEHCRHWSNSIKRFEYLRTLPVAAVVHQEDLTDDPDQVFRRLFDLADLPYDSAPTQYALRTHVHPLADESVTKGVNVKEILSQRAPPYESWSSEQLEQFREICGDAMTVAGYSIPY